VPPEEALHLHRGHPGIDFTKLHFGRKSFRTIFSTAENNVVLKLQTEIFMAVMDTILGYDGSTYK
jgi:hypothetical protein